MGFARAGPCGQERVSMNRACNLACLLLQSELKVSGSRKMKEKKV
jgi:hypothetical protein